MQNSKDHLGRQYRVLTGAYSGLTGRAVGQCIRNGTVFLNIQLAMPAADDGEEKELTAPRRGAVSMLIPRLVSQAFPNSSREAPLKRVWAKNITVQDNAVTVTVCRRSDGEQRCVWLNISDVEETKETKKR